MKLLKLNPITNSTRHQINIQKSLLSKKNNLIKQLLVGFKTFNGRSSTTGRITVRHKGGGCKYLYRKINFSNNLCTSVVLSTMYDPVRSAFIFLNYNLATRQYFNSLATTSVYAGSVLTCKSINFELSLGCRMMLKSVPSGSIVHSLARAGSVKAQYIRAAGTYGELIEKNLQNGNIKLASGKIISVPITSYATLGVVSNSQHNLVCIGKAGRNRLQGKRPTVRGIAMNPVDHPHGGRTNGGRPSVTPWGIPTKGMPTTRKIKK